MKLVGYLALGICALIAGVPLLFRRIQRALPDEHDDDSPRYRYTTDRTYDFTKAIEAKRRAETHATAKAKQADRRSRPTPPRKESKVVPITGRRRA
jgi:hypothetical protein